jgi:hypothetical protein
MYRNCGGERNCKIFLCLLFVYNLIIGNTYLAYEQTCMLYVTVRILGEQN